MKYLLVIDPTLMMSEPSEAIVYKIVDRRGLKKLRSRFHQGDLTSTKKWVVALREEFFDADIRIEVSASGTILSEALLGVLADA